MSIVRMGMSEDAKFGDGYEAIFGKTTGEKPAAKAAKKPQVKIAKKPVAKKPASKKK